jgi:hypothetical protein
VSGAIRNVWLLEDFARNIDGLLVPNQRTEVKKINLKR